MAAKYGLLDSICLILSQKNVDFDHQNIIGFCFYGFIQLCIILWKIIICTKLSFFFLIRELIRIFVKCEFFCAFWSLFWVFWAPIHFAAFLGDCRMISLLLSCKGINVNVTTEVCFSYFIMNIHGILLETITISKHIDYLNNCFGMNKIKITFLFINNLKTIYT